MSDAAQASGSSSAAQPSHADLGMSPQMLSFLLFLGFGLGGGLFLFLIGMASQGGTMLALILIIPWLIITGLLGIRFLGTLLGSGALIHRRTKAAIKEGRIGVLYFIRSWIGDNIIIVDEARRLLCVNGELIGFDAVRKVGWESDSAADKLEIILVSGANPVRSVNLGKGALVKVAFERLCNTLRLSS